MKNFQRLVITFILVSLMVCSFSVTTNAMPLAYEGFSALYSLLAKDFAILVADEVGPVVAEVWNALTKPMQDQLKVWEKNKTGVPTEDFIRAYVLVMIQVMKNNPLIVHRLNKTALTEQDVVAPGTQIEIKEIPLTSEQLDKIATETARTKNVLVSLLQEFEVFTYDLMDTVSHIPESLTAIRTQITTKLGTVDDHIVRVRDSVAGGLTALSDQLTETRKSIISAISDLCYGLGERLNDVNIHAHAIREILTKSLTVGGSTFLEVLEDQQLILSTLRKDFNSRLESLQTTVSTLRKEFNSRLESLQTTVSTIRTNMNDKIADLKKELISAFTSAIGEVKVVTKELNDSLTGELSISIAGTPSFDSDNEDNKKVGIGGGLGWFGNSYDLLGEYGVGLLAAGLILRQFTDMKYFDSLITISLSIGLVAVFFGIFLNVAQADNAKSKQAQRTSARVGRGG